MKKALPLFVLVVLCLSLATAPTFAEPPADFSPTTFVCYDVCTYGQTTASNLEVVGDGVAYTASDPLPFLQALYTFPAETVDIYEMGLENYRLRATATFYLEESHRDGPFWYKDEIFLEMGFANEQTLILFYEYEYDDEGVPEGLTYIMPFPDMRRTCAVDGYINGIPQMAHCGSHPFAVYAVDTVLVDALMENLSQ